MLRHVDLCSGIGGFAYAFETVGLSKPVLFCDIEPWSRKILVKHWPYVPIAKDVKELANDPDGLVPDCDIITAGYPCQSFSVAGKRRGSQDDRHIWPYIFSIIQKKRCSWCVFENVLGHVTLGLDQVLSDLEREGYATRPFVVPACATDAPHRRDRIFIIARNVGNPKNERCEQWSDVKREGSEDKQEQRLGVRGKPSGSGQDVADTISTRSETWASYAVGDGDGSRSNKRQPQSSSSDVADTDSERRRSSRRMEAWKLKSKLGGMADGLSRWVDEPGDIPRVSTGVPNRVQRLRGLGNAIVPKIAMRIGQTIKATYDA